MHSMRRTLLIALLTLAGVAAFEPALDTCRLQLNAQPTCTWCCAAFTPPTFRPPQIAPSRVVAYRLAVAIDEPATCDVFLALPSRAPPVL